MTSSVSKRLYENLVDEEDARVCRDISEAACRATPQSFVLILASYVLTKLGDALASPKTVLPWLATAVGAPAFVVGFLVPIRESGSMLPQIVIGHYVRRLSLRKWVWVVGSLLQAATVVGLGLVAFALTGAAAGAAILVLVALFSLSRGLASVASKDVLGKTVPKTRRGQLTGWSAGTAGLITVGAGAALLLPVLEQAGRETFGLVLCGAGLLWVVAAAIYSGVREYPGATDGGRDGLGAAFDRFRILVTDPPFRRFILTRALLMCSALTAPYYVALAQRELGSPAWLLGAFVIAAGLASLLSAPVWGRFADRSSRRVMVVAALITGGCGLAVVAVGRMSPDLLATFWCLPVAYFVLMIAHAGVRVGRKTYVVDLGSGNRRTDYVAVGNTLIGLLLLVVGSVGLLVPWIGLDGVILMLATMGLAGAMLGVTLPETQRS